MATQTVFLAVILASFFVIGYCKPSTTTTTSTTSSTTCCAHPAFQSETTCCPEVCCRPGISPGGCCEQKTHVYKSAAPAGEHHHHSFVGIKLFLSFKLTSAKWAEVLTDHYSEEFVKLSGMVTKALKFYSLIPGAVFPKVVTFSAADTGTDVITNVVVKIPWRENQEELLAFFQRSLQRDIQQTGILDTELDVDQGSLVIHDIERRGGSEEEKSCCHSDEYANTCCPESCCVEGASVVPCCPKRRGHYYQDKPVILCHGVTNRYVIRIKGLWDDELTNPDSAAFEQLQKKLTDGLKELFARFRDYAGAEVIAFRQDGTDDVIAKFDLKIIDTVGAVPCHLEKDLLTHVLRIVLEEAVFTDGAIGDLTVDVLSLIMPQKLHAKFSVDVLKPRWKPFCNILNNDKKGHSKSTVTIIQKKAAHVVTSRPSITTRVSNVYTTATKKSGQPEIEKPEKTDDSKPNQS